MNSSTKFSLNNVDWKKIAVGAGVAITGALLTYISQTLTTVDFGQYTPIVVAFWSVVANIVRKWMSDYTL